MRTSFDSRVGRHTCSAAAKVGSTHPDEMYIVGAHMDGIGWGRRRTTTPRALPRRARAVVWSAAYGRMIGRFWSVSREVAWVPQPTHSDEIQKSALAQAEGAALVVDESGIVLFASDQASRMLKYGPGEIAGQSVELLMPERFRLMHIGHRLRFTDDRRSRLMGAGLELYLECGAPVRIYLHGTQQMQ